MVKVTDAQMAARYQNRETLVAKKTHWKGCHFCKLPINANEHYKPGTGLTSGACLPCVNKLSPPPTQKATPQAQIDCAPPSADWAKLFEKEQANTAEAHQLLADLTKEAKILRAENDKLKEALKFFELLVDAAMKLIAQERKFTSTAFMSERLAIKRLLIMMNRWTDD